MIAGRTGQATRVDDELLIRVAGSNLDVGPTTTSTVRADRRHAVATEQTPVTERELEVIEQVLLRNDVFRVHPQEPLDLAGLKPHSGTELSQFARVRHQTHGT